jgi:hypothetical protein
MIIDDQRDSLKFRFSKPKNSDETLSAIYEELSVMPRNQRFSNPEQTIKGSLEAIRNHLETQSFKRELRKEGKENSEAVSLGIVGFLGLLLAFVAANGRGDGEWWRTNSYFFFLLGAALTVIFVTVSMEKSLPVARMLKSNSVKILCAFIFSAVLIVASAEASGLLNSIFGIDGGNFPYTRALLSAVFFLKMCTPILYVLGIFSVIHAMVIWAAARSGENIESFPWNSIMFVLSSLIVAGLFWWITHGAFGEEKIRQKAYKMAHHLDFSAAAYCVNRSDDEEDDPEKIKESYLFFGQDQNKVLIDAKLDIKESFEEFLKGTSVFGTVSIPKKYKILPCSPGLEASAP